MNKMYITALSAVLADGIKVPSTLTLKRKTVLKEHLPSGITIELFQSILNAIHQNQEPDKETRRAAKKKENV